MCDIAITQTRGGTVENQMGADICIVNHDNRVVLSVGDINRPTFTRSALKLHQVIPLLENDGHKQFGFSSDEIAIMCGSHNGEENHLKAVRSILSKIGCSEGDLLCGAQMPTGREPRNELRKTGKSPSAIHNNCSGKHAGFLALSKLMQQPINEYLQTDKPVQEAIKKVVAEMHEINPNDLAEGEDGCSAPNFAFSIYHQAIGYKNIACTDNFSLKRQMACQKIIECITANPEMIAGNDRFCTAFNEVMAPGIIGKTGADGIYSLAFTKLKLGATVKISSGAMGPQYSLVVELLEKMRLLNPSQQKVLSIFNNSPITNWNRHVVGSENAYLPDYLFAGFQ